MAVIPIFNFKCRGDGQGWVLGTPPCLQISVKQNKPLKDLRLGCALEITRKLPSSRSLLMLRRLENRGWGWESGKSGESEKSGKGGKRGTGGSGGRMCLVRPLDHWLPTAAS